VNPVPAYGLGLRRGAFTCVGWQVTLCDPIWQETSHSSVMGVSLRAIRVFNMFKLQTSSLWPMFRWQLNIHYSFNCIKTTRASVNLYIPDIFRLSVASCAFAGPAFGNDTLEITNAEVSIPGVSQALRKQSRHMNISSCFIWHVIWAYVSCKSGRTYRLNDCFHEAMTMPATPLAHAIQTAASIVHYQMPCIA